MKKGLCETCYHGLVKESEHDYGDGTTISRRCLLDHSTVEIVTLCTRYRPDSTKTTYHDPEFDEYAKKVEDECSWEPLAKAKDDKGKE
jgi:hypothetical protein